MVEALGHDGRGRVVVGLVGEAHHLDAAVVVRRPVEGRVGDRHREAEAVRGEASGGAGHVGLPSWGPGGPTLGAPAGGCPEAPASLSYRGGPGKRGGPCGTAALRARADRRRGGAADPLRGARGRCRGRASGQAVAARGLRGLAAQAIGRDVAFADVPPEAFAAALSGQLPAWQVDGLIRTAHHARGEARSGAPDRASHHRAGAAGRGGVRPRLCTAVHVGQGHAREEDPWPRSVCMKRRPRRRSSSSPGSPTSGPAAPSFLGAAPTGYLEVHDQRPRLRRRHGGLRRDLGTLALRLVGSRPRRAHDHRLEHVGRRLGPHLHLHAATERDDGPGRRRGPRRQELQGPRSGSCSGIVGKHVLGKELDKTVKAIEARNDGGRAAAAT